MFYYLYLVLVCCNCAFMVISPTTSVSYYRFASSLTVTQSNSTLTFQYYTCISSELSNYSDGNNAGYLGWIENYTDPNLNTFQGYYNSALNSQPLFLAVYYRANSTINNVTMDSKLDQVWMQFILNAISTLPQLINPKGVFITNTAQVTSSYNMNIQNTASGSSNQNSVAYNSSISTGFTMSMRYINTDSILAEQFSVALNTLQNYINKITINQDSLPSVFNTQAATVLQSNSTAPTLVSYAANNDIVSTPISASGPFMALSSMADSSMAVSTMIVPTSQTYQIYQYSTTLFNDLIFFNSFVTNYTQNCWITVYNNDPTNYNNIIGCTGSVVTTIGSQINTTTIFTVSATALNWTGTASVNTNWTYVAPSQPGFAFTPTTTSYQVGLSFNASFTSLRINNSLSLNCNISSLIAVQATQVMSLFSMNTYYGSTRIRQMYIQPSLRINLNSTNLQYSINWLLLVNAYTFQDTFNNMTMSMTINTVPISYSIYSAVGLI